MHMYEGHTFSKVAMMKQNVEMTTKSSWKGRPIIICINQGMQHLRSMSGNIPKASTLRS